MSGYKSKEVTPERAYVINKCMPTAPTNTQLIEALFQSQLNYCSNPRNASGEYWALPPIELRFDSIDDVESADLPEGCSIVMTHDNDYIPAHGLVRRHDGGIPFHPFQLHAVEVKDGEVIETTELTRAFWNDGFTIDGRMTEQLGRYFYILINKIALRANWRGYTYRDEFEDLALEYLVRYALKFDQRDLRQNPTGYLNMQITNAFRREIQRQQKHHHSEDNFARQQLGIYAREENHIY